MDNDYRICDKASAPILVGVMLDLVVRYGRDVLRGIHRGISQRPGWRLVSISYHGMMSELPDRAPHLSGFIGGFGEEELPRIRGMFDGPVIGVSNRSRELGCSRVVNDLEASARMMFDFLSERYYRSFCFVGTPPGAENFVSDGLWEAFEVLAERQGASCARTDLETLRRNPAAHASGTAFVVYSDVEARHCVELLTDAGLRVPDDAAVLGVWNFELENMMSRVPLSTLLVDGERIGELAVDLLEEALEEAHSIPQTERVPPLGILERASTQSLYARGPEIRELLLKLRRDLPDIRTSEDCAKLANMGRRTLERRFQSEFGTGIASILRRLRVDYARQLILSRDVKLEEIAELSGFADGRMLGLAFQKVYGETPSAFRARYKDVLRVDP